MKPIILLLLFCVTPLFVVAQQGPIKHGMGFGFQLNQYQKDFGIGLQATSPYFGKDKIAIRARFNGMFYEHPVNNETTWTIYSNLGLGIIGVSGTIQNFMRLYGEGGILLLFPSADFSSKNTEFGGYGLFGFEFFMSPGTNYFIEIGGVGTGANADKIPNNPIYSNGLLISVGFRVQL